MSENLENQRLAAPQGEWRAGVFHFPIRVYYEDTDVGGMVYHGRYISFFERVRTESIRGTTADIDYLFSIPEEEGGSLTYVVSKIAVSYHQQAKVGDLLIGHSRVDRVRGAAIEVKQWITRGDETVAKADVLVAIIGEDGRPRRWPRATEACWRTWYEDAHS